MYQQPASREAEEEEEKAKKLLNKRQNKPASTMAAEQAKLQAAHAPPPVQTAVKAVEESAPVAAPKVESGPISGPRPAVSEQTKTKEVTKVDRFVSSFVNEESGHQTVSVSESELIYNEHEKAQASHLDTSDSAPVEIEKGQVQESEHIGQVVKKEDQTMLRQAQAAQIVQARPMLVVAEPKKRKEAKAREKEMLKIEEILPAQVVRAEVAQKTFAPKAVIEREVKTALDLALEHNRPALVVSSVLEKRQNEQFTESLMQVDERRLSALAYELDHRLKADKMARMRLMGQMVHEQDLVKKRRIRVKLKKLQIHIAFYSKTKGMIGRLLGGFFGKLASLLKK